MSSESRVKRPVSFTTYTPDNGWKTRLTTDETPRQRRTRQERELYRARKAKLEKGESDV